MKTYVATPQDRERNWLLVDATGQTLGRLATQIADALRGKRKPTYTPHVDTGDFVVVVNAEKISVSGNKLRAKRYYRHSGYPGGLRSRSLQEMLDRRPEEVLRLAVKGMLPRNRLARKQLTKLKIYAGPDHPHAAQQPQPMEIECPNEEPEVPETPEPTPPSEEPSASEAGRTSETEGEAAASGATASDADVSSEAEAEPAPPEESESAPEPPAVQPEEPPAAAQEPAPEEEAEELEPTPRVRPEIPGADLIPDIIPEGDDFMDAEARRAAAEAEAEAQAEREREEREEEEQAQPIADAAIDLAAGARYTATGKRKTAVARVILKPGSGSYAINGKPLDDYFPRETLRRVIRQPLETVGYDSRMDVVARMHGGGVAAQAEALRHGISRALIVADPHLRGELKRRGFLTRDPRVKERKKAGLKKARKRPQFSKR